MNHAVRIVVKNTIVAAALGLGAFVTWAVTDTPAATIGVQSPAVASHASHRG